jgi:hypothetical protein
VLFIQLITNTSVLNPRTRINDYPNALGPKIMSNMVHKPLAPKIITNSDTVRFPLKSRKYPTVSNCMLYLQILSYHEKLRTTQTHNCGNYTTDSGKEPICHCRHKNEKYKFFGLSCLSLILLLGFVSPTYSGWLRYLCHRE